MYVYTYTQTHNIFPYISKYIGKCGTRQQLYLILCFHVSCIYDKFIAYLQQVFNVSFTRVFALIYSVIDTNVHNCIRTKLKANRSILEEHKTIFLVV